jgi:hypothetical protein
MNYIVCGWYTPDYTPWRDKLVASLDGLGIPHDIVEVEKREGGWELNTMSKPVQIAAAMRRHPDKRIVFLDVDCEVTGTLREFEAVAAIAGDVGCFVRTRFRSNGSTLFRPRSGTLVFSPTAAARYFVAAWVALGAEAPRYAVDQDTMLVAFGKVSGLSITWLDLSACATAGDKCAHPVILHDSASRESKTGFFTKLGIKARRRASRLAMSLGFRPARAVLR